MLSFVGRNFLTPARSLSERNFHTYRRILKTLVSVANINTNLNPGRIQLSVTKSFNPLLPINIYLQLVVCKLLVMSSPWQHESRCLIQKTPLRFFVTVNSPVINSYLLQ